MEIAGGEMTAAKPCGVPRCSSIFPLPNGDPCDMVTSDVPKHTTRRAEMEHVCHRSALAVTLTLLGASEAASI